MKVVSASEMQRIEALSYQEGASDSKFMAEAGKNIAHGVESYCEKHNLTKNATLLCGKGNNGGDTYVAGTHLLKMGFHVIAYQIIPLKECTKLCQENYLNFSEQGGVIKNYFSLNDLSFSQSGIILDGLFGTGFHGTAQEPFASVIKMANQSGLPILAVDIPSGINGDTGSISGEVIKASATFFLELPKAGFFLQNAWNYVGQLHLAPFGLPHKYVEAAHPSFMMITDDMARKMLPPILRNRHKYQAGYVVGIAGSAGMPGAALLSSWATLRGGAGITRLLYPDAMQAELANSPYELIKEAFLFENSDEIVNTMNRASAIFLGPGIGRTTNTRQLLKEILPQIRRPCVIDGDALTIIGEDGLTVPQGSVLTPHKGEMLRLLNRDAASIDMEFLRVCQAYADKYLVTLVLKGGPSFIFHPGEAFYMSDRGDPGMATAGSGDVLTGLIAALLAQALKPQHAAILGVYLHGLAGESAAHEKTSYCMTSTDIIEHFPDAFMHLLLKANDLKDLNDIRKIL